MTGLDRAQPVRPARYGIAALAILFVTRVAVSFQFQSVAPLSPLLDSRFPISLSGLGLLLGFYMAPGVAVALFLPALTARWGRTPTVAAAFLLMAAGEAMLWSASAFETALAARVLAGTGGCIIYIITINMVADLDTSVPSAARMGVIAAAWPFGNAFALAALGWLAYAGPDLAKQVPLLFILLAMVAAVALLTTTRRVQMAVGAPPSLERWRLVLSGMWPIAISFSLYNIGFIILTGFAGRILLEDGMSPAVASGIAGIPMWMFILSVPLGGVVAGRSLAGDRRLVAFGCLAGAAAVLASSAGAFHWLLYAMAGLAGGLPTAPMLARGRAASPEGTDMTYSALFFVFFAALIVLPPLAGHAADLAGTSHIILWIVAGLLVPSVALFARALRAA